MRLHKLLCAPEVAEDLDGRWVREGQRGEARGGEVCYDVGLDSTEDGQGRVIGGRDPFCASERAGEGDEAGSWTYSAKLLVESGKGKGWTRREKKR